MSGKKAFNNTVIQLDVFFDPKIIDPKGNRESGKIMDANYRVIIKNSLLNYFPEVKKRNDPRHDLSYLKSD